MAYSHEDRIVNITATAGKTNYSVPFTVFGLGSAADIDVTVQDTDGNIDTPGWSYDSTSREVRFRTAPEAGATVTLVGLSDSISNSAILATFAQVNAPNLNAAFDHVTARIDTIKQLLDEVEITGGGSGGGAGISASEVVRIIGTIETDQLNAEVRNSISDKIEAGSLSIDGKELSWDDGHGNSYSIVMTALQTMTEVDARVRALVSNWAEVGNGDPIPASKLTLAPGGAPTEEQIFDLAKNIVRQGTGITVTDSDDNNTITVTNQAPAETWARPGNTDQIPVDKLGNAPSGGGGGLTTSQVDARVVEGTTDLRRVDEAISSLQTTFNAVTVQVGAGSAYNLVNPSTSVPDGNTTDRLIITVGSITKIFTTQELHDLPQVSNSSTISASNALEIENTADAEKYWIARNTNDKYVFSSDTVGDFVLTIMYLKFEISIDVISGTPAPSQEQVFDQVKHILVESTGIDISSDDPTNTITFSLPASYRAANWAIDGSTSPVPVTKLPAASATAAGSMSDFDFRKLRDIQAGAETNVNADWNATSGDAQILNKPAIGNVSELKAVGSIPPVAGYQGGDIVNVAGELYELVAGTEDPHIYRGVASQLSNNYIGDAVFSWQGSGQYDVIFKLNKAVLGVSPPATIYIRYNGQNGQVADVDLNRAQADDTATEYVYDRAPGSASIDPLAIGDTFDVETYSDTGRTTALTIQAASANRFERDNRDLAVLPPARTGNVDPWSKAKLPSDVVYTGNLPASHTDTVFNDSFPGFTVTRADQDTYGSAIELFSPAFDVTATQNQHGVFFISLEVVVTTTDVNGGFESGKANQNAQDRRRNLSAIVYASDVRAADAWASTNPERLNGPPVASLTYYSGPTIGGHIRFTLPHNTSNNAGLYHYYEGLAGAVGFTLAVTGRVIFVPNDAASGGGGLTQAQVNNLISAGVLDWAETGNSSPIPVAKLPSASTSSRGTMSAADKTKLDGIATGAEVNVQSDWDAASGDAQILNKPTILSQSQVDGRVQAGVLDWAETGNNDDVPVDKLPSVSSTQDGILGNNDYNKLAGIETGATTDQTPAEIVTGLSGLSGTARLPATAVRDIPTTPAVSWYVTASPTSTVNITTGTPGTAGAWGAWADIATTAALTSTQAGRCLVAAHTNIQVSTASSGGGDRIITQTQIVRTRASMDTVIADSVDYAPRNVGGSQFATAFGTESRKSYEELIDIDDAMSGDVYKLRARAISQLTSGTARALTASTTGNDITVSSLGGTKGDKGEPGTGGLDQSAVDARIATFARVGDASTKVPQPKMNFTMKQSTIFDAFDETWTIFRPDGSGYANVTYATQAAANSAAASASYISHYTQSGAAASNQWCVFRIEGALDVNKTYRFAKGPNLYSADGVTATETKTPVLLRTSGVYYYYAAQFSVLNIGDQPAVQVYDPLVIDSDDVVLPGPTVTDIMTDKRVDGSTTLLATSRKINFTAAEDTALVNWITSSRRSIGDYLLVYNRNPDGAVGKAWTTMIPWVGNHMVSENAIGSIFAASSTTSSTPVSAYPYWWYIARGAANSGRAIFYMINLGSSFTLVPPGAGTRINIKGVSF